MRSGAYGGLHTTSQKRGAVPSYFWSVDRNSSSLYEYSAVTGTVWPVVEIDLTQIYIQHDESGTLQLISKSETQ